MKLLSLNIWGGRRQEPLLEFLKNHQDIDAFCFQEVFNTNVELTRPAIKDSVRDIHQKMATVLSGHQGYYCVEQDDEEGIAQFIHQSIPVKENGQTFVHRWKNAMRMHLEEDGRMLGRALQYARIISNGKELTVAHLHGLWNGQGKTDSASRLEQSKKAQEFLRRLPGPKILMGDFNLLPETESMKIFEEDMRNLIKEYKITSTRSSLYEKPERYADYVLVSPEVKVIDFKVLPDTVSDHSPLYLEIR